MRKRILRNSLLLSSELSVISSAFYVLRSQLSVLSTQFCVLSTSFADVKTHKSRRDDRLGRPKTDVFRTQRTVEGDRPYRKTGNLTDFMKSSDAIFHPEFYALSIVQDTYSTAKLEFSVLRSQFRAISSAFCLVPIFAPYRLLSTA